MTSIDKQKELKQERRLLIGYLKIVNNLEQIKSLAERITIISKQIDFIDKMELKKANQGIDYDYVIFESKINFNV